MFLHGDQEMEELLDDENEQNSPRPTNNNGEAQCVKDGVVDTGSNSNKKQTNKNSSTGKKNKKRTLSKPVVKNDLPKCYVKLEKTKIPKTKTSEHNDPTTVTTINKNDDSFTDFQRTVNDASSDTEEERAVGVKRKKRRPLCVMDDSD